MPSRPCGTPVLPFPSIISATIPPCRPIPLFCNLLPPAPHWKPGTVLPLPLPVPYQTRQVPSLLGMSVAEARRRLAIVELLPTLPPSNLTEGTITAQDPLPGTLLHRNAHVRLVTK